MVFLKQFPPSSYHQILKEKKKTQTSQLQVSELQTRTQAPLIPPPVATPHLAAQTPIVLRARLDPARPTE